MKHKVLLLTAALLGQGCMAKKMAVNNADFLFERHVQRKVPIASSQRQKLAKDIDVFLNEKKETAKVLRSQISEIDIKDPEKTVQSYHSIKGIYFNLLDDYAALMAKYISELDSKQQKEYLETQKEENKRYAAKSEKERLENIKKRFKWFFGTMSPPQEKILQEEKDTLGQHFKQRDQARKELREAMKGIFNEEAERREERIRKLLGDYLKGSFNDTLILSLFGKVLPTLSEEQQMTFYERRDEIQEILGYFIKAEY